MDEWDINLSENEDEDDSGLAQVYDGSREALIFLIDANKAMFDKGPEDEIPFETCVKCAKTVMQSKIVSNDRDLIGVVFFGTDKSSEEEFKNVFVFQDLKQPGAEKILQLEKLLESLENEEFEKNYGHNGHYLLSDAFWTCLNLFNKCTPRPKHKRILLFTNDDSPHPDNSQHQKQALSKAEDLRHNGVELILMHMDRGQNQFDAKIFYKDVVTDDDESEIPDSSDQFDELLTRVRIKSHKKRMLKRMPLVISEDFKISVGVYLLCRTCNKPPAVKLYKKTNEEVKVVTKSFLKENGELVTSGDMKKSLTIANKTVFFSNQEVQQIKSFGKTGLHLVGFKQKSLMKPHFHVRHAQFIYPDESTIAGSTTFFTALLKKCLERNVVAICQYIFHGNSPPRFVALWPQEEEMDENKIQVTPPGFHIMFLPFADDFRKISVEEDLPRANKTQIEKAKELVKKLQFAFTSESFENPQLQQHYAAIEALALERDAPEEVADFTQPDEGKIEKRAGKLIKEFKELIKVEEIQSSHKKKGPSSSGKSSKSDDLDFDLEKEAKAQRLNKLTVPVLRDCIKKLHIRCTGTKKADLIDAIQSHFGV